MDKYNPVTHVIFDLDGLLLDTESIYFRLDSQVCAKYGKEFTKKIKQKVLGTTAFRSAEIIVEELNLPISVEDYVNQVKEMLLKVISEADMMPGAERLMLHLHKNNIPFAIATSAGYQTYLLKKQRHEEIFSLIDHITAASSDPEVKHGKPAPDVFLVCAERFKDQPEPKNCLVFEDAPNGVIAAVRAGMQVVMVPADYIPDELKREATLVLKSLEDFRPELFGLPPYSERKVNE